MGRKNGKFLKEIIGVFITLGLIIGVFTALLSWGVKAIFFGDVKNVQPSPTPRTPVICPVDYESYSKLAESPNNTVLLIKDKKIMFAAEGRFINTQVVVTKSETATSKIRCGYLFVSAGTNNGALVPAWEDVVIYLDNYGGHLIPDNAIWVNNGALSSQYLYSLDKIKYWDTHFRNNIIFTDWSSLLNVSNTIQFTIKLNTENRTGFIDNVSIAYKCWNPTTGDENNDCNMKVISSTDEQTNTPAK